MDSSLRCDSSAEDGEQLARLGLRGSQKWSQELQDALYSRNTIQ